MFWKTRNQNRFNSRNPTNPFQNRFRSPNPNFRQQGPKQTKKELFDSICKEYNEKNGCTRQYDRNLNSCKLNSNTRLFISVIMINQIIYSVSLKPTMHLLMILFYMMEIQNHRQIEDNSIC